MSFAERWTSINSKSVPLDNKDKNDKNINLSDSVLFVPIVLESENLKNLWGDHQPLVEWFFSVKSTLPTAPFCLWQEGKCSLWWMTPAASYRELTQGIETGPEGEHAPEVRSILEQLHYLFSEMKP